MKSAAASQGSEVSGLGNVLDFMRVLWAVDHGLEAASKRMEMRVGVTGPQRFVIRIVGRFPGISAGRLAEVLHLHPSTLTGILKRLEQRGLITRRGDPADGRRALFELTARGARLDALRTGTVEASVRRTLGKQPERKIAAARDVLEMLALTLGEL